MDEQDKVNLNTAVFTTRFVLENNSPILFVYHHVEDGAWEFLGGEEINSDNDYRVVSMEEIINLDKSLIELLSLRQGSEAFRSDMESPWIVK
jgi:hypothetical protein